MAKKSPPTEQDNLLKFILNNPINTGSPGFEVPTYRDPSKDFETLQGSVDPLGGVDFEAEPDWLAKRDAEQSLYDAWGNGIIKAVGKAGTTAIEGVGALATLPFGLIKGVSSGDWSGFYDNALGDMMDGINESLADAFPNYSSRRDATFDADFWADQFLGGAGYMAGAILGGEGIGLIGKAIGGGLKATSLLQLGKGTKIKDLVGSGSKLAQFGAKLKDPTKQLAYSLATATSEAAVEARDVKNVLYDDLFARRDSGDLALQGKTDAELMDMSKAAGNAAFAFNLPVIAASNFLTFGKALTSKYGAARKTFGNVVGDIGETAVKKQSAILSGLGRFGEGAISEGSQELAQLGISEGSKKYYLGQYSSSADHFNSLWGSVVDETIKNLGTKEGFESMFLGAILGGPTSAFVGQKQRAQEKKNTAAYSELLNNPALQSLVSNLSRRGDNITQVANASAQQDGAIAAGDKFGFKNSEYDVLKGLTKQAVELGGADTFIDKLEALKESDLGEFNKKFSNPEGEFATVEERNKSIDDAIQTVKSVAKAYDNIIVSRPELNPLVAEKTPELTQAKRHIFDAIFDAVTNFEDIDTREKDIASKIMGLTATTDSKMVASIYGPYMKEYVKKGIDYEKFRNSDDYKEKYGNTVQEYIDAVKEENPDKAANLETLSKDLYKLAERREEMIKQYNEAIEQPEKIQKEAEEALEKLRKAQEEQKAEADKQAAEALKAATEVTPQPAQTPEEAANLPLTPEQVIGGTPGTVIEPKPVLPVTGEIVQTNASLQEINDAIDELEEQLFYEESDGNTKQVEVINEQLEGLKEQKRALEESLSNKIDEEDKELKAIEAQKEEERKEAKKKQEEEEAKKAATQKVVVPENKKEKIGFRTFGKLMPPSSQKDKKAAQKVLNTTPLKELLAGLTITISPYEGTDTVYEYVTWAASKKSITFSYKGTVLGYLQNPNKIIINETGQGWGDLSLADKQNYFKLDEPKGTPITFDMIDAERNNLLEIYKNLENKEGEFTLAELPFIQVTPSLGEYLVLEENFPTLAEIEDTYTVVKNKGEIVIYDTAKENTVNDNLPKKLPVIPEKLKKTNRYLLLVNNGYEQRWIAMQPTPLLKTEFADIYKDVLALQKRILAGEKISQEELDLTNNAVKQKYFVAENRKDKKYTFASLSDKGTFTLREVSFKRGNKESDKVVDGKSGIKTIDKVYEELFKIGTIKGNEETLRATVGFKNGGLKVTINKAEAEKVKAEKFTEEQKEPVVTTTENTVEDIERRRKQLRGKALEAIGVDERRVDGSRDETHSKAKDYPLDRAITLAENQITANPISKLGALPMDAANAIKAELHIAGVKATDKTPLSEINDKLKEIKVKYDAELAALEGTPTKDASKEITKLRAKEEVEVKKIIPNIEEYKVDGVINKDKVLEGIEERKQEELKNTEDTKQTPSFYLGLPVGSKKFLNEDVSVKFNNQESVYEFHYTNPAKTKATFKVTDNPNSHLSAIRSKDVAIETVSTATNAFRTDAKRVNTIEEGEAELIDGYWVVTKKAKIEYGDSPLDKTKAVEDKYKAQADAYNEIYDRYDKLITDAAKSTTTTETEEIISTTPEQLKKDVAALLDKALQQLKEANATGKNFILGFHGGRTFDKADRTKQYTGEFRDPEVKRVAESAGARYEGEMLFYTEDLSEEGNKFTYETAIRSATAYAIKYGDDTPSIQAYLIPLNETQFANKGLGEVGVTYDDIEADKIRKIGSVDFTRKIVSKNTTEASVTETKASVKIPTLTTVKVDLASLSIDELNNVAKQLRQKAVDARQAEKEGKTVLGGSASVESDYQAVKQYIAELTTPVTKPLSKTQKAEAEKANMPSIEDIDADKFFVSNMPATVRIQMEEAIAYLKSIVPFEVDDIDAIANRLTNQGITFGAFIDNVIYLNKAAQTGTEYHEAFHGVMSLFSTEERTKYLEVAKKEHKITAKQRAEFKIQRPVYQNYTDAELDKILLEEYLADKFMAWKQGKKEPNGFFAKMFDKIKNFFNNIKDYFSGNLDSLFHRIDSGKFKNRPINKGSRPPLFMALPYRTVKIAGTDEYSVKKLNSTEENNLLGSLQYLMVNELVEGDKTIKQAFDKAVEVHYAKFTQAGEESALEGEEYNEYYEKNAGLLKTEYVKKALYEKLKSRVQFLLAIDQDIEDRILSKEEAEDLRDYDKSALQVTGLPTLSQYVRLLIASSSVEVTDSIGVTYRRALNPSTVYNGIERTLLNTKPDNFMKKLEVFSVYNSEVNHFVTDLKQKLNWNSEANAPGLDNKGEVKNAHIWNAFQQAFHKYKVGSLMTVLDASAGESSVTNSNFKDVDTQQVERWKVGFKNFMDKHYHEISMEPFVSLKVTDGYSDEELEDAVREVKLALDEIGIKVSPLYIQYSILKNKKELTPAQENLMGLYDNFYGLNGSDGETLRNIVGFVNEKLDPFKEGDEGALARLKSMAMENAYFDETAGTSTFQNAEGELVADNQLGSFFLKRVGQLQSKQARSENEKEFTEFYSQEEDSWMVPLHFIATQNNPLYKHEVTFDKNFMFYSIDGIRAEETTDEGKETGTKKDGVVFKHMAPLEKILTFFSLYNTTKYKTVKEGKETKKIPYAYYYPQVIETASTGYAILLPVNPYYAGNKYSEEFYADMFSFIKNEHARIRYLLDNKVPSVTNFTTKAKNGLTFFTNSYLSETVQAELKSLATLDDISDTLYNRVKEDITKYVENDFKLMMANLVKEGVVTLKKGEYTTGLLPKEFTDRNKVDLNKIRSMQLNYLVNVEAFNTLLHGDLAYKVKNPEDHVKRLKGANGTFPSLFGESISVKVIPDVIKNKEVFIENGKKVFKDVEEVTKKNEHNTTDGQANNTLDFQIKRLFKLGKTSPKVMAILSKVQEGAPLTREELETLEAADCLLNPKKDLIYGPNAYIKMSALTLIRELTSYKVDGKWEAIPGRERIHDILEDMLANNIDLTAYESASKGTTIVNEVREINGDYYGEQVSTKGVKTKITDGTQHLALIWSELPLDLQHLVEQLDKADQERIIQSTEYALSLLKDKEGVTTLAKVLPDWYDGLVATGASPQLLDIFRPNAAGNPSLNPNIAISIDKFTAMYLAHWSNNALKQKVAGAKFTLVSPTKVIVHNGKVIRAEQFKANPEAYKGYDTRELAWNKETTKEGKTILYSEAIVSSYYKELYNLKVGDEIPEDLAYMLGYRIPTEDKPSMTVLKIVDFLPAIYGSAIMVPEEVQFLSGADFDIDSLFAQKYDIYEKDGKFYKYGSATTLEGKFEEFINYAKKETDVEAYQKTLLEENNEYQYLIETEKELRTQIEAKNQNIAELDEKLREANDFIPLSLYEESEKEITRSWVVPAKSKEIAGQIELIKEIKEIQERKKQIQANKLASALRYYNLPASKTAFKAKYPDGKFKAVLNNEMLSLKIEMLGNPTVQNTLAFEKTSNEPLTEAEERLSKQFPETFTADKASLSFFSFNDLAVAMANNDAGSDGIGPTAVFNVLYQYLAKVNATLAPGLVFTIKSKEDSFNHAQFRGVTYKKTGRYERAAKRIVRSISALISAMTDNAKDPIAARLNLNLETLGPVAMMLGTGVSLEMALKIVNSPIVKELTTQVLNASSSFVNETQYSIVQAAESDVAYLNAEENSLPLVEEQLNAYLLGKEEGDVANIALNVYLKARKASQYLMLAKDIVNLRKGVPATFAEVDKMYKSYTTLLEAKGGDIMGLGRILEVGPLKASTQALEELKSTATTLFISEHPKFKEVVATVGQQTLGINKQEISNRLSRDFNSFVSLSIFRKYLEDTKAGKTKKYKARFIDPFIQAFTKEALFESTLIQEVQNLQRNAKALGLENNRFLKYISTKERENTRQVDKIEGNTRQLRNPDYQEELINSFDDLYSNPKSRDTAIKLVAYILLKDGARYKNNSFQSEIPAYMFTIYSDALDYFSKNPNFVDATKIGDEFIKVWSLNKVNSSTLYYLPPVVKGKKNPIFEEAVKQKVFVKSPETLVLNDTREESKENNVTNAVMANYNFKLVDKMFVPNPFVKVGYSPYVLQKVDGVVITDLSNIPSGTTFEYASAEKAFKVTSLNAYKRGTSAYSFPLSEAIELYGTMKNAKEKTAPEEEFDEWADAIDPRLESMPATDSVSDGWIEQQRLAEEEARAVSTKEYKEIKAAETTTEDKNIASVMSPVDGLAEYGITIDEEFSDDVTTAYLYKKDIDPRVKAIVEAAEDKGTTSPSQVLLKIKEADTENVFKKFELC